MDICYVHLIGDGNIYLWVSTSVYTVFKCVYVYMSVI